MGTCETHLVKMEGDSDVLEVVMRPDCRIFIEQVSAFADLVVFTAARSHYAAAICSLLDPFQHHFEAVLSREHTLVAQRHVYIKDLSRLGRDLKRTILVDNSAYGCATATLRPVLRSGTIGRGRARGGGGGGSGDGPSRAAHPACLHLPDVRVRHVTALTALGEGAPSRRPCCMAAALGAHRLLGRLVTQVHSAAGQRAASVIVSGRGGRQPPAAGSTADAPLAAPCRRRAAGPCPGVWHASVVPDQGAHGRR